MVKDPVCGMAIEERDAAATRKMEGQTFYFCSDECAGKFDAEPHAYVHHEETPVTVRDPVCGMEVDPTEAAATRQVEGQAFYFCSDSCAEEFDADPHAYLHRDDVPVVGSATTGVNPGLPGPDHHPVGHRGPALRLVRGFYRGGAARHVRRAQRQR